MKETLKSQLAVFLLKFVALLPQAIVRCLAKMMSFILWYSNSSVRKITEVNIGLCFKQHSPQERRILAKQSVKHTVLTGLEMPSFFLQSAEVSLANISKITHQHLVNDAMAKGHGIIIIAPHLGNWEYLGQHLAASYTVTNLYKPAKIKAIDDIIMAGRSKNGATLVPTNKRGVMALLKALKRGEVIGVLPDQIPDDDNGTVYAPLFDDEAATMTLISNFIQRTDAKAFAAFAKRLDDGSFEIVYQEVDSSLYAQDIETSVAGLNKTVENLVLEAPEQYQWEYKRFKKGREGSRRALYR